MKRTCFEPVFVRYVKGIYISILLWSILYNTDFEEQLSKQRTSNYLVIYRSFPGGEDLHSLKVNEGTIMSRHISIIYTSALMISEGVQGV